MKTLICAALIAFGSMSVFASTEDETAIKEIIAAIEYGWENGDGEPFRKHFLDFEGARYIESGGQNELLPTRASKAKYVKMAVSSTRPGDRHSCSGKLMANGRWCTRTLQAAITNPKSTNTRVTRPSS
mgnify:CR=1 FL=1